MSVARWSNEEIAALVVNDIDDINEAATWVAVILAESGGNPVAYNLVDEDPTSRAYLSTDNGMFQINSYWHGNNIPVHEANRPELAWRYSLKIATGDGAHPSDWSPWVAYTSGAYLTHLDVAYDAVAPLTTPKDTDMDLYEPAPGWDLPAAGRCRTGMQRLTAYLLDKFAASNLGCYVDRPKTGGSSPSLHRDGRAIDIGFAGALDDRDAAFDFLVANAKPLGVQMVLNYKNDGRGGYRWRLPYSAADPNAGIGPFGSSGHWLHIERTNAGADDTRTVTELITPPDPTDPPKDDDPMFRYRNLKYLDQFAVGASGAIKMTPTAVQLSHFKDLPLVENNDRDFLVICCQASGFDFADLTPA